MRRSTRYTVWEYKSDLSFCRCEICLMYTTQTNSVCVSIQPRDHLWRCHPVFLEDAMLFAWWQNLTQVAITSTAGMQSVLASGASARTIRSTRWSCYDILCGLVHDDVGTCWWQVEWYFFSLSHSISSCSDTIRHFRWWVTAKMNPPQEDCCRWTGDSGSLESQSGWPRRIREIRGAAPHLYQLWIIGVNRWTPCFQVSFTV